MFHVLKERDLWVADSPAGRGDGIGVARAWFCRLLHVLCCAVAVSQGSVVVLLGQSMQVMSKNV